MTQLADLNAVAEIVGGFSRRRVLAMVRRHYYLLRGSLPRILEMAYWPTLQMVIWGFVTQFFMGHSSWVANASGILIGAGCFGIYCSAARSAFPCAFSRKCGLAILAIFSSARSGRRNS